MLKKIMVGLGVVVIGLVIFGFIYVQMYKMDKIESSQVNSPDLAGKVLIASQGSEFKNALVAKLTAGLSDRSCYIKIVDASALDKETAEGWNAIVILHTIEMYKAPGPVHTFLDKAGDLGKVFLVTTAGDEEFIMDYKVDAVTSASEDEEIDGIADKVLKKVRGLLPAEEPAAEEKTDSSV